MAAIKSEEKGTTRVAIIHAYFLGVEYSCIYVSMLYYLQDMEVSQPAVYFCIISSLTAVSSLIFGALLDRFEKLRTNLRRFMIVTTLFNIVGNFLYTMQFSLFFLFVGRFMCGIADTTKQVVFGEFQTYFNEFQLDSLTSMYQISYTSGFVTGPIIVAMLSRFRKNIGYWHITPYNGIAYLMAWFFLVLLLLIICFVKDINKVDPDAEEKRKLEDAYEQENKFFSKRKVAYEERLKQRQLLANEEQKVEQVKENPVIIFDAKFLAATSILVTFVSNSTEMLVVFVAVQDLKLPILNFCFLVASCLIIFAVGLTKLWRKLFNREDRRLSAYVTCIVVAILSNILLIISVTGSNYHGRVFTILLIILLNSVFGIFINNATLNLMAVVANPIELENLDNKREIFYRLSGLCGILFAAFLKKHLARIFVVFILLKLVILIVIFVRRKKLVYPQETIDTKIKDDESEAEDEN